MKRCDAALAELHAVTKVMVLKAEAIVELSNSVEEWVADAIKMADEDRIAECEASLVEASTLNDEIEKLLMSLLGH